FAQRLNMLDGLLARAPTAIQTLQCITQRTSISFVIRQHTVTPLDQIEVTLYRFGIEMSQRGWVAQVIEKQLALPGNSIEWKSLNAESGLFRCGVTGGFSDAQVGDAPRWSILRGE